MDPSDIELGQAIVVDWSSADYINDRKALTRSAIGLLPYSPLDLGAWLRGDPIRQDQTDDMAFGTALHIALLEPGRFSATWLPKPTKPADARSTAPAGTPERRAFEAWKHAVAAHEATVKMCPDALPVTGADLERINSIREAVRQHDVASTLLSSEGISEQTIVWREPVTGLLVKVRVDRLARLSAADVFGTDLAPGLYDTDLKTSASDSPGLFARSGRKYGYLPQASLYVDVTEALYHEPVTWMWVVAATEPDRDGKYGVSTYPLTSEQRARGREIYMAQLVEALDRLRRDDWTPAHRHGVAAPLPL